MCDSGSQIPPPDKYETCTVQNKIKTVIDKTPCILFPRPRSENMWKGKCCVSGSCPGERRDPGGKRDPDAGHSRQLFVFPLTGDQEKKGKVYRVVGRQRNESVSFISKRGFLLIRYQSLPTQKITTATFKLFRPH